MTKDEIKLLHELLRKAELLLRDGRRAPDFFLVARDVEKDEYTLKGVCLPTCYWNEVEYFDAVTIK